jgi:hypothetical protein
LAVIVRPLVDEHLKAVWPADSAVLTAYEVGFTKEALVLRLGYQAPRALDTAVQETMRNALRRAFGVEHLNAILEWQGPRENEQKPKNRK